MNTSANLSPERGRTFVLILTLINTVLAALITTLQVDATIRSSQAQRDSQAYAAEISGGLVRESIQADYEMNTYTIVLTASQESLMAQYSAQLRQEASDQQGYEALTLRAQISQTRADRASTLSALMTDPAYAPASIQELPDIAAYLADQQAPLQAMLLKQNAASDAYHRWSSKSDSYVAVLTVLAVAFFLLGIAQIVRPGLRLFFAYFAIAVIGISLFWSLILIIS
jgi:hypothetical protein